MLSPNTEDLAAELVAFANGVGGGVFLGVEDSGAVEGIPPERLDVVERWTINIATHNCEPPIRPILRKVLLPAASGGERHVLLAEVPRGLYVHRTSGGRYYYTPPELARLFQQRGREYVFDEQPGPRRHRRPPQPQPTRGLLWTVADQSPRGCPGRC